MEKTTAFVLNETNYNESDGTYTVKFQQPQDFDTNTQISLAQISMYNSFGNVFATKGNNVFSLWWPDGDTHKEYIITCDDGFYNSERFYTFLISKMETLKLYTLTGTVKNYPITIAENNSLQVMCGFYNISHLRPRRIIQVGIYQHRIT
jgi:glutamine cyclotransferase